MEGPMKKFSEAKIQLERIYENVDSLLGSTRATVSNSILLNANARSMSELIGKFKEEANSTRLRFSKEHMKAVFFGGTSSGKSTLINAILKEEILPAFMGHTTDCFINIRSSGDDSRYLITAKKAKNFNIQDLKLLADALKAESVGRTGKLDLFLPPITCPFLQYNGVLVDTPGIDLDKDLDSYIQDSCKEADVFVLVVNSETILRDTEKRFFQQLKDKYLTTHLSSHNVFVVFNRWDLSDRYLRQPDGKARIGALKNEHLERAVRLLVDEMNVCSNKDEAKELIFFISAEEALTRVENESSAERRAEFKHFETKLYESVFTSAVQAKFSQPTAWAQRILGETKAILEDDLKQVLSKIECTETELSRKKIERKNMELEFENCKEEMNIEINDMISSVQNNATLNLKESISLFLHEVQTYQRPFKSKETDKYKHEIAKFVDTHLHQLLKDLNSGVKQNLKDCMKKMKDKMSSKLRIFQHNESSDFELNSQLEVIDRLCEGFIEDLRYKWKNLLGIGKICTVIGTVLSGGVIGKFAIAGGLEITVKTVGPPFIFASGFLAAILSSITEIVSWFSWNDKAKRNAFNNQLVEHLKTKLDSKVETICQEFRKQIQGKLSNAWGRLLDAVNNDMKHKQDSIDQMKNELYSLGKMEESLVHQTAASKQLSRELKEFDQRYLTAAAAAEIGYRSDTATYSSDTNNILI